MTAGADLGAIYTWQTWLVRVLAQVVFFALLGRLVASPATTRYLVVGNAVLIVVIEAMFVVASTTWERREGTLPLLVAAPGCLPVVFVGRSVRWLADGAACATVAFVVVGAMFRVPMPFPRVLLVLPLVTLVALSTHAFGLVAAAVVQGLPVTHGLAAIRGCRGRARRTDRGRCRARVPGRHMLAGGRAVDVHPLRRVGALGTEASSSPDRGRRAGGGCSPEKRHLDKAG
jgi:hypothetical protein